MELRGGLKGSVKFNGDLNVASDLHVRGGAEFGIASGRPLKIIPTTWKNDVTYLGFFRGSKRTGYFMKK